MSGAGRFAGIDPASVRWGADGLVAAIAQDAVDGRVLYKDDFGEVLSYDLPEVKGSTSAVPTPSEDCPTCGGDGVY